jgi:arylsulfatase A-like enzyme
LTTDISSFLIYTLFGETLKFYAFQLMHVTDWLPTLLSAAGGNLSELAGSIDGIDQWNSISNNQTSPRKQVILDIDEVARTSAIRDGDWKLVIGEHLSTFQNILKCMQYA